MDVANRILFDFDQIENIKTFNPENQATIGTVDSILVFPMKEVVWNDEFISRLEKTQEFSEHLELTDTAKKAKDKLIEELKTKAQSEGEELVYPVLWDEIYIVEYGTPKTNFGNGILFDDEENNRKCWSAADDENYAFSPENIIAVLKGII